MASVGILLQSKNAHFPDGIGNNYDQLGRNIMDHHYKLGASAKVPGHLDKYYRGRRPNGFYIPRFVNLEGQPEKDYLRGYGYQGGASRGDWSEAVAELGYGRGLKEQLLKPGQWQIGATGFGEMLPYHDNRVRLSPTEKDPWGLPQLDFDVEFKENEYRMREDITRQLAAMFEAAGLRTYKPLMKRRGQGWASTKWGVPVWGGTRVPRC